MRLSLLLSLSVCVLVACIPGQSPKNNIVMPVLLGMAQKAPSPDAIPTALIGQLFPTSGPYRLGSVEKGAYTQLMNERYKDGFYDPQVRARYAADFAATIAYAREQDGVEYEQLLSNMANDIRANLAEWDLHELESFQFVAGNSIVMSTEMLRDPLVVASGVPQEWMVKTIDTMTELRKMVIDEMMRRGDQPE